MYEAEYGQFGGEPFGCLVVDYYFDQTPPDAELLGEMSKVAAAAHTPFIAGASPTVMQMETWQELANPRDLTKIFTTPEYAGWRSMRESEDARYLGLAMPRYLSRLPYGAKTSRREFDFEEDTGRPITAATPECRLRHGGEHQRSFKQCGWCSRIRGIESGGSVEAFPRTFPTDDGGVDMKCPTEIAISDRREAELAKGRLHAARPSQELGLRRVHRGAVAAKNRSVTIRTTANAICRRGCVLFACCRFAPAKCIVRDKIGSFKGATICRSGTEMDHELRRRRPGAFFENDQGAKPLAAAEVRWKRRRYRAITRQFFLRPHYQLEG